MHTKVEVVHDNASNYISKEQIYGCTKGIHQLFPHIKAVRGAPLVTCYGKTNLDRFYTTITTWINTYQLSTCIATVEQMVQVLNNGSKGALVRARELGKPGIPCSVNLFELEVPKSTASYVFAKNVQCITYITEPENRRDPTDTGYYINMFPWMSWRRGWTVPLKDVCIGEKSASSHRQTT